MELATFPVPRLVVEASNLTHAMFRLYCALGLHPVDPDGWITVQHSKLAVAISYETCESYLRFLAGLGYIERALTPASRWGCASACSRWANCTPATASCHTRRLPVQSGIATIHWIAIADKRLSHTHFRALAFFHNVGADTDGWSTLPSRQQCADGVALSYRSLVEALRYLDQLGYLRLSESSVRRYGNLFRFKPIYG